MSIDICHVSFRKLSKIDDKFFDIKRKPTIFFSADEVRKRYFQYKSADENISDLERYSKEDIFIINKLNTKKII